MPSSRILFFVAAMCRVADVQSAPPPTSGYPVRRPVMLSDEGGVILRESLARLGLSGRPEFSLVFVYGKGGLNAARGSKGVLLETSPKSCSFFFGDLEDHEEANRETLSVLEANVFREGFCMKPGRNDPFLGTSTLMKPESGRRKLKCFIDEVEVGQYEFPIEPLIQSGHFEYRGLLSFTATIAPGLGPSGRSHGEEVSNMCSGVVEIKAIVQKALRCTEYPDLLECAGFKPLPAHPAILRPN